MIRIEAYDLNEDNTVTRDLPEALDNFLQDFAQVYGGISYNDIMELGKSWDTMDKGDKRLINKFVKDIKSWAEDSPFDYYELSEMDDTFEQMCDDLVRAIKNPRSKRPKS